MAVLTRHDAVAITRELEAEGRRLVLTNGCFDILHVGHVRYLAQSRAFGDALMIGVNTDASVQRLKGPSRPLVPELERAEMLEALKCVDFVTLFNEDTAEALVRAVRPAVYAKGGDYSADNCPEARFVLSYGGVAEFIPLVPDHSTTGLLHRLR